MSDIAAMTIGGLLSNSILFVLLMIEVKANDKTRRANGRRK